MAKPKRKAECMNEVLLTCRVPRELVDRLERHVERMRKANPYMTVMRADAIRTLLGRALDEEEARERSAPAAGPEPEERRRGR